MLKLMHVRATLTFVAVAFAVVVVASPALAVTVYTWTTDEGTTAFTNDPKRVPSKYKQAARQRTVGSLKGYPHLTESQVKYATPYAKRVQARLNRLRAAATPARSAGPVAIAAEHPLTLDVATTSRGMDQLSIPVTASDSDPIVTTSYRVRMRDSIASQHIQVTKQGDRVLSVRVSENNARGFADRPGARVRAALPVGTR